MRKKPFPHVAVIIINWNGLKDTRDLLDSFKKVKYPNFSLIVVDNGSQINEAEILEKEYKNIFTHFKALRLEKNYGYAEGCDIGVMYAKRKFNPPYFVIMNNDLFVHPDFLTNLVSAAEACDSLGVCAPKIYCYPEKDKVWWQGPYKYHIGWRSYSTGQWGTATLRRQTPKPTAGDVNVVTGCCMLIKSKVIEQIGLLDPRFFLTGLDSVDYSLRAKAKGFKSLCVPSAIMWHKFGQAAMRRNWFRQQKDAFKAMVIFYSRHGKSYKLPSLIFFYILDFLKRDVLEGVMFVLTDKEKREKFKGLVRHTIRGPTAA